MFKLKSILMCALLSSSAVFAALPCEDIDSEFDPYRIFLIYSLGRPYNREVHGIVLKNRLADAQRCGREDIEADTLKQLDRMAEHDRLRAQRKGPRE